MLITISNDAVGHNVSAIVREVPEEGISVQLLDAGGF